MPRACAAFNAGRMRGTHGTARTCQEALVEPFIAPSCTRIEQWPVQPQRLVRHDAADARQVMRLVGVPRLCAHILEESLPEGLQVLRPRLLGQRFQLLKGDGEATAAARWVVITPHFQDLGIGRRSIVQRRVQHGMALAEHARQAVAAATATATATGPPLQVGIIIEDWVREARFVELVVGDGGAEAHLRRMRGVVRRHRQAHAEELAHVHLRSVRVRKLLLKLRASTHRVIRPLNVGVHDLRAARAGMGIIHVRQERRGRSAQGAQLLM